MYNIYVHTMVYDQFNGNLFILRIIFEIFLYVYLKSNKHSNLIKKYLMLGCMYVHMLTLQICYSNSMYVCTYLEKKAIL